eukprot:GHUV01053920.1.p1 GENE.GHUV01053920.1~~GHUV01053920.1.p1  ORF type:complete len:121 (-),score=8.50 GHUV01053920.1:17-379(-)
MFVVQVKHSPKTVPSLLHTIEPQDRLLCSLYGRERRLGSLVIRQDRFLYIATATLLHLAEDTTVQRKMRKRDICGLLVAMLARPHVELLLLATGFLRRLCVYQVCSILQYHWSVLFCCLY